ncbi:hypothetical protein X961_4885 [Burkholderia pseudomallei MSHR5613]|nr:hypothetical protein X961_4885 [Burkholderia pseudomallei MSHR5613]
MPRPRVRARAGRNAGVRQPRPLKQYADVKTAERKRILVHRNWRPIATYPLPDDRGYPPGPGSTMPPARPVTCFVVESSTYERTEI